ncbi:MAG: phycobiliprotein lyase, partial [Leptolyngbyaceae cyanobacterium SL_7_1]|nr:phycobiliprotein lyase [Leptolyngbyaceae cyanobacterium SL_7_1]
MEISDFVDRSIGHWRSQRSAHHLAFRHFEAVHSEIHIAPLPLNHPAVLELCQRYQVPPAAAVAPFQMDWEGHSDWDDAEIMKGTAVLVPVPLPDDPARGTLLRDQGYAETIPAAAAFHLTPEGMFVLSTTYDHAAAEERIWFESPTLRFRVSLIKTS